MWSRIPEAAPVGGEHQVVKVLLNGHSVDGGMGEIHLEGLPISAVVEGNVESVFRAQVKQPFAGTNYRW